MMTRLRGHTLWLGVSLLLCCTAGMALAEEWEKVLIPARPDMPLANPITTQAIPPPPLSLLKDRPVNPAYVPGLPGLPQGKASLDDFGNKKPKYDGALIRQSRVQDGQVMIPAGGLVYLEDTWRGEVALVGERIVMWTNKEAMAISAGERIMGPENYFAVVVDETQGNEVLSWHVEDRQGNRTVNLGGPDISNIDLVLGQGRIAGQSLLKDIGRSALQRLYTAIEQREDKRTP